MNWWQTLIVSVVPVLLTLIITNVAESKRRKQDAAQREQDRAAEERAQAERRRASIEDHWRNERLARMTTLVEVVGDLTRLAIHTKATLDIGRDDELDLRHALANDVRKSVLTFVQKKDADLPAAVMAAAVIASQKFYANTLGTLDEIRQGFRPLNEIVVGRLESRAHYAAAYAAGSEYAAALSMINTRLINAVREELTGDVDSFIRGGH